MTETRTATTTRPVTFYDGPDAKEFPAGTKVDATHCKGGNGCSDARVPGTRFVQHLHPSALHIR